LPANKIIDHIDRDSTNNRIENLRLVEVYINNANRETWGKSRWKGVSWWASERKWVAQVTLSGHRFFIGRFTDEIEAAIAFNLFTWPWLGNYGVYNSGGDLIEL
jgi:hypothetical protein